MKIIIEADDDISTIEVLWAVMMVVKQGRISESRNGPCFAFANRFTNGNSVYADRTPTGTDTFKVYKSRKREEQ